MDAPTRSFLLSLLGTATPDPSGVDWEVAAKLLVRYRLQGLALARAGDQLPAVVRVGLEPGPPPAGCPWPPRSLWTCTGVWAMGKCGSATVAAKACGREPTGRQVTRARSRTS